MGCGYQITDPVDAWGWRNALLESLAVLYGTWVGYSTCMVEQGTALGDGTAVVLNDAAVSPIVPVR
jgi:hypothetical protein